MARRSKVRKFKTLRQWVESAFDPAALCRICTMSHSEFAQYGKLHVDPTDHHKDNYYYYRDNGAPVLGVAHLDSVHPSKIATVSQTDAGLVVHSGALDDRLGVYVITELLPALGIHLDWLLTTGEESGHSTAGKFTADPGRYNWMFQFDRTGTDVVMYEYQCDELTQRLKACGFKTAQGSFSDICWLNHLGIQGFNVGVGYEDYHGPRSYAYLSDTFDQVTRFVHFYRQHSGTLMPYEKIDRPDWLDWPSRGVGRKVNVSKGWDDWDRKFSKIKEYSKALDFPCCATCGDVLTVDEEQAGFDQCGPCWKDECRLKGYDVTV